MKPRREAAGNFHVVVAGALGIVGCWFASDRACNLDNNVRCVQD